ncbi:MAG: fused MFS/spermidine synthase [Terriglobales bacterium]
MSSSHQPLLTRPPIISDGRAAASDDVSRVRLTLWLVTPFFTGAAIMAQELVAFRLYAPYFGYSIYVWGSMISVVMAALAVGYGLGGWIADRSQTDFPLYCLLLASAFYQLAILFAVRSLLRGLSHTVDFRGAMFASLIIFAPSMMAMATAGPFLIRLLARFGRVGFAAGGIYAISTIGSIAGILVISFFLLPHFGTQRTLEAICAVSALTAVSGLALRAPAALLTLGLVVVVLRLVPPATWPPSTIWAAESAYNLVRVVRNGPWIILTLNDERGVHTIHDQRTGWTGHYYDDFALGPLLAPSQRLLVLGMGGGGSISSTRVTAPEIDVDAVEIDPKVVEAAQRFFGLNPNDGKLHIHVADARPWLASSQDAYDLVHVDLYQGGPYIPFYLVTEEFFQAVRAHMTADGLLMMNVFDTSRQQELLTSTVATLKQVYPTVIVLAVGSGNRMLLVFSKQTDAALVRARLESFEGNATVKRLARRAATQAAEFEVPAGTAVFTDDFAPVEEITRRMLNGK